ncbi:MAG: hypothetical protein OCC45_08260 [Desulfotalea sp.]
MQKGKILVGMKEIQQETGRGRVWLEKAIKDDGFPAVKIGRDWESNTALIDEWHQRKLRSLC